MQEPSSKATRAGAARRFGGVRGSRHDRASCHPLQALPATRDADMRYLVATGLAWMGGPKTQKLAADWLVAHLDVSFDRSVPPRIARYVKAHRSCT